jgi:hypothetical protein
MTVNIAPFTIEGKDKSHSGENGFFAITPADLTQLATDLGNGVGNGATVLMHKDTGSTMTKITIVISYENTIKSS